MALRPLTRITLRGTDGLDHHFYIDLANMPPADSAFLNDLFPEHFDGIRNVGKGSGPRTRVTDFHAMGYYDKKDLGIVKEALAKSIVATGESPTPPNPR